MTAELRMDERLRAVRRMLGLSIRDLTRILGIRPSTIIAWERGTMTPAPGELARLACATHVLGVVLFREDELLALRAPRLPAAEADRIADWVSRSFSAASALGRLPPCRCGTCGRFKSPVRGGCGCQGVVQPVSMPQGNAFSGRGRRLDTAE